MARIILFLLLPLMLFGQKIKWKDFTPAVRDSIATKTDMRGEVSDTADVLRSYSKGQISDSLTNYLAISTPDSLIPASWRDDINDSLAAMMLIEDDATLQELITNGGYVGQADWVDTNADGMADDFHSTSSSVSVEHREYFKDSVQVLEDGVMSGGSTKIFYFDSVTVVNGHIYRVKFKYKSLSSVSVYQNSVNRGGGNSAPTYPNYFSVDFTASGAYPISIRHANEFIIDELSVKDITNLGSFSYTDGMPDNVPKFLGQILRDGAEKKTFYAVSLEQRPYWKPLRQFERNDYLFYEDYRDTITVKASGGDFTSIKTALESIIDSDFENQYLVLVDDGVYSEYNLYIPDYVTLSGKNRDKCIVEYYDASPPAYSYMIHLYYSGKLKNMTIKTSGLVYCLHIESQFDKEVPPKYCVIDNVAFYHNTNACVGMGVDGGQYIKFSNCFFHATGSGSGGTCLSFHDGADKDYPATIEIYGCYFNGKTSDIKSQGLGSGQLNNLIIQHSSFKYLWLTGQNWYSDDTTTYLADKRAWDVRGVGNTDFSYNPTLNGVALKISSNTTGASSSVRISGNYSRLFGDTIIWDGATGVAGYVKGNKNILREGVGYSLTDSVTSMGRRLGDCSSVNKTFIVDSLDGADVSQTVTFKIDYTSISNEVIIDTINAYLSGATASLDTVLTEYYPDAGGIGYYYNNSDTTLLPKTVVCFDSSLRDIRKMKSSDAADLYCGVVLNHIKPGESGRVIVGKKIQQDFIDVDVSLAYGYNYGVVNGQFVKDASPAVAVSLGTEILKITK